jgi:hypothetical protein
MEYSMADPPFFGYHALELSYFTQSQGLPSQAIESYSINPIPGEPASESLPPAGQPDSTHSHISHLFDPYPTPYTTQQHNVQPFSDTQDIPVPPMGPPANTRKRKAPTLPRDAWLPYKDRIIELHITRKLPLREVKTIIEKEFGFTAEYVSFSIREGKFLSYSHAETNVCKDTSIQNANKSVGFG